MTKGRWEKLIDKQVFKNHEKQQEVKLWKYDFTYSGKKEEFLEKVKIASKFNMRYRGFVQFYGNDLIAYQKKYKSNKQVTEFLEILSTFFTDHLEYNCPSSWNECGHDFWEELIYTIFPRYMKFSKKQNESERFINQLLRFVQWIDERHGCLWFTLVENFTKDSFPVLKYCEYLLNELSLHTFPKLHDNDWNFKGDFEKLNKEGELFTQTENSVFEVINVSTQIITLKDLYDGRIYQILHFPSTNLKTGILLDGIIGKTDGNLYWTWHFTSGVYPLIAMKYFQFEE